MIYIVFAPPGSGKSYYGTWLLTTEHKRRKTPYKWFFSNYYVYDAKHDWSPFIWDKDLVYQPITDSLIVIDEAWLEGLNSRDFKNFNEAQHAFYATCRHQNNDIYILTQAVARVEKVVRELATEYAFMSCVRLPLTERPLWFNIEFYLSETDVSSGVPRLSACYRRARVYFCKSVARCYDTHTMRVPRPYEPTLDWRSSAIHQDLMSQPPELPFLMKLLNSFKSYLYIIRMRFSLITHKKESETDTETETDDET